MYASIALGIDTFQSAHGERWTLAETMICFRTWATERASAREKMRVQRTSAPLIFNRLNLFPSKVYNVHQK